MGFDSSAACVCVVLFFGCLALLVLHFAFLFFGCLALRVLHFAFFPGLFFSAFFFLLLVLCAFRCFRCLLLSVVVF